MKKSSIILFVAVMAFAFSSVSAQAGSRHGYGYNGSEIIVKGNFPAKHVGFFSNLPFPPPPFFPFISSTNTKKRVNKSRYRCDCCYRHNNSYRSHHSKYRKHYKRDRKGRHWDDYDDEKEHRSHRNRRNH